MKSSPANWSLELSLVGTHYLSYMSPLIRLAPWQLEFSTSGISVVLKLIVLRMEGQVFERGDERLREKRLQKSKVQKGPLNKSKWCVRERGGTGFWCTAKGTSEYRYTHGTSYTPIIGEMILSFWCLFSKCSKCGGLTNELIPRMWLKEFRIDLIARVFPDVRRRHLVTAGVVGTDNWCS